MRLVQITDLHIDPRDPANGQPALEKFRRTIARINRFDPAAILITGDFCLDKPRIDIYEAIAAELKSCTCPIYYLGGNHDSVAQMTEIFGLQHLLKQEELYYSEWFGDREILFLDTHRGIVSETQLQWLTAKLAQHDVPMIVFSHHPPLLAGVPFMDNNYPLTNHEQVLNVLRGYDHALHLFCGHYHVERSISVQQTHIYITPSASYQIDALEKEFVRDHDHPGYRIIDLLPDRIETAVRYLW